MRRYREKSGRLKIECRRHARSCSGRRIRILRTREAQYAENSVGLLFGWLAVIPNDYALYAGRRAQLGEHIGAILKTPRRERRRQGAEQRHENRCPRYDFSNSCAHHDAIQYKLPASSLQAAFMTRVAIYWLGI